MVSSSVYVSRVPNFRLAVNRKFSEETDYFPCSAFGRLAEFAEKYLFQGIKVVVNGRMENNNYTNKDGDKVYGVCLKLDDGALFMAVFSCNYFSGIEFGSSGACRGYCRQEITKGETG
ncbi:single-stranded DNA-binding protein [Sporofaciens musculi]|uniref:single-stranded DNA-binding protein n=1 Tax=Sporofaciens musculi TaxID=2681861 RepID=UPI00258C5C5F|nr:single-stranded DNA-binding protein [Sporofaciens musculi]